MSFYVVYERQSSRANQNQTSLLEIIGLLHQTGYCNVYRYFVKKRSGLIAKMSIQNELTRQNDLE